MWYVPHRGSNETQFFANLSGTATINTFFQSQRGASSWSTPPPRGTDSHQTLLETGFYEGCRCNELPTGHWSGSSCSVCQPPYMGTDCTMKCVLPRCSCSTSDCGCTASPTLGYFSGTNCSECAKGFIGFPTCLKNAQASTCSPNRRREMKTRMISPTLCSASPASSGLRRQGHCPRRHRSRARPHGSRARPHPA